MLLSKIMYWAFNQQISINPDIITGLLPVWKGVVEIDFTLDYNLISGILFSGDNIA